MRKFGTPSGAACPPAIVTVGFELVGVPSASRGGGGCIGLEALTPPLFLPCFLPPFWAPCAWPKVRLGFPLPAAPGGAAGRAAAGVAVAVAAGMDARRDRSSRWTRSGPVGPVGPSGAAGAAGASRRTRSCRAGPSIRDRTCRPSRCRRCRARSEHWGRAPTGGRPWPSGSVMLTPPWPVGMGPDAVATAAATRCQAPPAPRSSLGGVSSQTLVSPRYPKPPEPSPTLSRDRSAERYPFPRRRARRNRCPQPYRRSVSSCVDSRPTGHLLEVESAARASSLMNAIHLRWSRE